jgi:hypothetical protein
VKSVEEGIPAVSCGDNRLEKEVSLVMRMFSSAVLCCLVLTLFSGCSREPYYRVDYVEITSIARSFPDRDDWLHVVEGSVSVRLDRDPGREILEHVRDELGIALYVYTKGNPHPMYFFQYISGEPDRSRIAVPYIFERADEENVYTAKWELTDIYFGDEEFNDLKYEAIALAGDRKALERLIQFMSMKSLLNLPNKLDTKLVFSEPAEVERKDSNPPADSLSFPEDDTAH